MIFWFQKMKLNKFRLFRNLGFIIFTIVFILVSWVTILTDAYTDETAANPFFAFAIENHMVIIIMMIIVAALFGFALAFFSSHEIEEREKTSKGALDLVKIFLGVEEKSIINHLVDEGGTTTQAAISRLPNMDKVKSYRTVHKMEAKGLVSIEAHGKVRKVILKQNILAMLQD